MKPLPTGVVATPYGFRTFQRVRDPEQPNGRLVSKRWPPDTAIKTMTDWREAQRVAARQPRTTFDAPVELTGFAADVLTYLDAVRGMPSYSNRVRDIGEWLALFGDRPRAQIQSVEILTARNRWLAEGPKRIMVQGRWTSVAAPLKPSTVNKRLRALENFFTVLDPHADNPVRQVPECEEAAPAPKGHTFAVALDILAHMPDLTTPKTGELAEPGSLSRVRFEVMLWTGLPARQVAALTPEHIDWHRGTVLPPKRLKGKRSRRAGHRVERPRPLLPQALAALKRYFRLGANRPFSNSALSRAVKAAIRKANRARAAKHQPPIPLTSTVYELTRHTFGTEAMRASRNLTAVQELMGHTDMKQTARYAAAAIGEQSQQAIRDLRVVTSGNVSPRQKAHRDRSRRTRTHRTAKKNGAPGQN